MRRNPIAPLPVGVFQETFSTGKLDANLWRVTSTSELATTHVDLSYGMLSLLLTQRAGPVSIGAEVSSKRKFGYGTYEFSVRASSLAAQPMDSAAAVNGSITALGLFFDGGVEGYICIRFEVEGLWQRSNNALLTCTNDSTYTRTSVPLDKPEGGFYNLKFTWTPTSVTFFINGNQVEQFTTNIPQVTGHVVFSHYGTNDADWGGTAAIGADYDRRAYISTFEFTPFSDNLARNPSMETKLQSFLRPYQWTDFQISFPDDAEPPVSVTWSAPTGSDGIGTALGLTANGAVPYVTGAFPRRFGVRTAPWESDDPHQTTPETRTGIKTNWQVDVWYASAFDMRIGAGGSSWTGMGLSWSHPPNLQEALVNPTPSGTWQRYLIKFKWTNTVEEQGNLYINVVGDTHAGDRLEIDNVDIYLGEAARPFVRDAEDVTLPITILPPSEPLSKVLGIYLEGWANINITEVPLDYNVINLFQAEPVGLPNPVSGQFTFPYYSVFDPIDVQTCRARGQHVWLTVGGANAAFIFQDRTQSQKFVESFDEFYTTLQGLDGITFNNFEQLSVSYPGTLDEPNPVWETFATEMVWIAGQLKTRYGSNFQITLPPAPGVSYAPGDRYLALAMKTAGVLDIAFPQFYDSSDLIIPATIEELTNEWVDLIGAEHVGIGLGANYAGGSSLTQATTAWNLVREAHPAIRGVIGWSAASDAPLNWTFGSTIKPLLNLLINELGLVVNAFNDTLGRGGYFESGSGTSESQFLLVNGLVDTYRLTSNPRALELIEATAAGIPLLFKNKTPPTTVTATDTFAPHWLFAAKQPFKSSVITYSEPITFVDGAAATPINARNVFRVTSHGATFVWANPFSALLTGTDYVITSWDSSSINLSTSFNGTLDVTYSRPTGAVINVGDLYDAWPDWRPLETGEIDCACDSFNWAYRAFSALKDLAGDGTYTPHKNATLQQAAIAFDIDDSRDWFPVNKTGDAMANGAIFTYNTRSTPPVFTVNSGVVNMAVTGAGESQYCMAAVGDTYNSSDSTVVYLGSSTPLTIRVIIDETNTYAPERRYTAYVWLPGDSVVRPYTLTAADFTNNASSPIPTGMSIANIGIADDTNSAHTILFEKIRQLPNIALSYFPGCIPFTANFIGDPAKLISWRGPPYIGYQSPWLWKKMGNEEAVANSIQLMADAQAAYVTQTSQPIGPFAPVWYFPRSDSITYGTPNTFGWSGPDPNTAWGGFQYRPLAELAEALTLCNGSETYYSLGLTVLNRFLSYLDTTWTSGDPLTTYPQGAPSSFGREPHMVALVLRTVLFADKVDRPTGSGTINSTYASLINKAHTSFSDTYLSSGPMAGTFSPDPAGQQWYGFWHGEILRSLVQLREWSTTNQSTWTSSIDTWLNGLIDFAYSWWRQD